MSGNVAYLRSTLHQLLEAESSIVCIAITNAARQSVISECGSALMKEDRAFEVPVRIESLPVTDFFEPEAGFGPDGGAAQNASPPGPLRTVGHVRVGMSAAPIFEVKSRALLVASSLVLLAAVLSCLVGLWLARRLRHTLVSVMSALRHIRQGRFDVELSTNHHGEFGELQRTIVQMVETLDVARHDLEQQVASRTQQLQQAVDQVRQADAEKRRLIVHSNALVEEDRRRMALEIHDHLGASLISVRLEAAALVAKADAVGDPDMARGARRIFATAESLYTSTRHTVKSLRPEVIDTLGLSGALEKTVLTVDKVHPACRFSFNADADLPDLRGEMVMPAYRVAQEALTNVVKHSLVSRRRNHGQRVASYAPSSKGLRLEILAKSYKPKVDSEACDEGGRDVGRAQGGLSVRRHGRRLFLCTLKGRLSTGQSTPLRFPENRNFLCSKVVLVLDRPGQRVAQKSSQV